MDKVLNIKYRRSLCLCLICLMTIIGSGCGKRQTAAGPSAGQAVVPGSMDIVESESEKQTEHIETAQEDTSVTEEVSFQEEVLTAEDAALFQKLRGTARETILLFDCADYDGDGRREAFAFTGKDMGDYLAGMRWYVNTQEAVSLLPDYRPEENIRNENGNSNDPANREYLQKYSSVYQTEEAACFWYTESDGASASASWLWGVKDGKPYETILSGKGMRLEQEKDGSFTLIQSSYDANRDGTGHTCKPCYFYYRDGAFHEYGAVTISREDFLSLDGAQDCVSSLTADDYWIRNVLLRGNGLVQVNLYDGDSNRNVTCRPDGDRLSVLSQNDGVTGLLVGEIASGDWLGTSPALQKLWEQEQKRDDGLFVSLRPNDTAWYDLDGDGEPESILYMTGNEDGQSPLSEVQLLINGHKLWSVSQEGYTDYTFWITDLQSADGRKELAVKGQEENDCFSMFKFLSYRENVLHELGDLKAVPVLNGTGQVYRIRPWDMDRDRVFRVPGDGTITAWTDTPVYANAFGSYYAKMSYRFDNSGMTSIVQNEYEITVPGMNKTDYIYTAQTDIPFYASPAQQASGLPSFSVPAGAMLKALALAPATGESVYVKMRRLDTQEEGWTFISDWPIFTETQGWG